MVSILIIEHKTRRIALEISEFIAPQKLVIIPFEESVSVTGLVGTTILGGRRLGFIVDVPSLMALSINKETKGLKKKFFEEADLAESETIQAALGQKDHREIDSKRPEIESIPFSEKKTVVEHEFVIELEKLFPKLNENIFALESDPGNSDLINAVFRLFHTIKGNLIMMGLPKGGETVHSVESILDQVRGEKQEIIPEMMDIIMDCVSYIEDIVKQMKTGEWEDRAMEDILKRSNAMLLERPVKHEKITGVASAEIQFSHEAAYRLPMHRRNKNPFYQVYIEFESFGQPSFLVACLIYKRICEVGDVLGTVPMLVDIEKGLMDGKIKILFTSNRPKDHLENSFKDLFSKHYGASCINFSLKSY